MMSLVGVMVEVEDANDLRQLFLLGTRMQQQGSQKLHPGVKQERRRESDQ